MDTHCPTHPDRPAASHCSECGAAVCEECGELMGEDVLCPRCARTAQPTAVLPQPAPEPDEPAPAAPERPSGVAGGVAASKQTLAGAVVVLATILLAALVVIAVLLARPPTITVEPPTPADSIATPSDLEPSDTEPEEVEPAVEPTEALALLACEDHFPTMDFAAKVGKHTPDWYFVTGYLGTAAGELEYQLELEWNRTRYEVTQVTPLAATHAPPPRKPEVPPPPPAKPPQDVVAEDPRFQDLEQAKYAETFNDGRRATVQVTSELAETPDITVDLEMRDGEWTIVGNGTEP